MSASVKSKSTGITGADGNPEFSPLANLVNVTSMSTEAEAEAFAVGTVVALESAEARWNERTITAKTNVGLAIFRAATLRVKTANDSGNAKVIMPPLKEATITKLGKLLGLTDTPGPDERAANERFGYKTGTLGACVDLARGIIGDYDEIARADVTATGETINERNLRSAILNKINPDANKNRAKGANDMAAAKMALVLGKSAGDTVKVKTATGTKTVKVDAVKLTAVKNQTDASLLTSAQLAAATDDQLAATLAAIRLVVTARENGTVKAPKPKPVAVTK